MEPTAYRKPSFAACSGERPVPLRSIPDGVLRRRIASAAQIELGSSRSELPLGSFP
jgi:hypothetical protein